METTTTAARIDACPAIPDFRRLRYFHGQLLSANDFQTEQAYFREKLKLHNRCLHGYGVVCGLGVRPLPSQRPCEPAADRERVEVTRRLEQTEAKRAEVWQRLQDCSDEERPALEEQEQQLEGAIELQRRQLEAAPVDPKPPMPPPPPAEPAIRIECGLALDCRGNEIAVSQPLDVNLWRELSPADRRRLEDCPADVYVSLCYCEQPVEPARPAFSGGCDSFSSCTYGKVRDALRVRVTLAPPHPDERCDGCCYPCDDPCVALARIQGVAKGQPVSPEAIDMTIRQPVARYHYTTITGISWVHGGVYDVHQARQILGTDDEQGGLEVRFSRGVLSSTLAPGVVDLVVVEGGRGRAGNIYSVAGDFVGLPGERLTTKLKYRQTSYESLQAGDRVLVVVRTPFILDDCCQPVDGLHVGGRVPLLPEYQRFACPSAPKLCAEPPTGTGRWTSGIGTGGVFESWFFIGETGREVYS